MLNADDLYPQVLTIAPRVHRTITEVLTWLQVTPACQAGPVSDRESSAICSARGCQAAATWAIVWNNPRLHTPEREKTWVACGEHKQPLADHLAVRSFLKRVERLEAGF